MRLPHAGSSSGFSIPIPTKALVVVVGPKRIGRLLAMVRQKRWAPGSDGGSGATGGTKDRCRQTS
jgi:hypothetical protein